MLKICREKHSGDWFGGEKWTVDGIGGYLGWTDCGLREVGG
jgi:hypothetical protein